MFMLKIKRTISLLLITGMLAATGLSASAANDDFSVENNDLYINAIADSTTTTYKTVEVTRGDFSVQASGKAELSYGNPYEIRNTILSGKARFVRFLVKKGDTVKKGDPIAEISIAADQDKIDSLQKQIEVLQENLDNFADINKGLLKKYRNIIDSPSESPSSRRTAQLLLDKLQVEYNEEYKNRSSQLNILKNQLAEEENLVGSKYITATGDGIITELGNYREGQTMEINNWMQSSIIAKIIDTSKGHINVSSNSELLRYGMTVNIVQDKTKVSMKGRVTTCNSTTLAPNLSSGSPVIEVLGDISKFSPNENITIQFESVSAKDVLLVNKNTVYSDSKGDYVFVLRDGNSCKQYVIIGGTNAKSCWIIRGLEEGDPVITK